MTTKVACTLAQSKTSPATCGQGFARVSSRGIEQPLAASRPSAVSVRSILLTSPRAPASYVRWGRFEMGANGHRRLISLLLLAWWVVVMQAWLPTTGQTDLSTALTSTDEGSTRNALQIGLIALLGLVYLRTSYRILLTPGARVVTLLFGAYLAWSLVTFLWSDDVGLSIRRYVQLVLVMVGAVGIGLGFYGTQRDGLRLLFKHVTVAAVIAQLVLWVPLLISGEIHLLDPLLVGQGHHRQSNWISYGLRSGVCGRLVGP